MADRPLFVPMPRRFSFVPDDVAAVCEPAPMGRRYSLDVSEQALAEGGRELLAHAMQGLCENIAREQRPFLEQQVTSYLMAPENREWVREVMRDAIFAGIHQYMAFISEAIATERGNA